MSLSELQNYTFVSKYARWLPGKNRRETWKECVDRVRNMMHTKYANFNIKEEIDFAYDMMYKKKVLGSQRALQYGGEPAFKHNARIYNCCGSYVDRLRFFQECMYLLLSGSGAGFSVQKHHIAKLPKMVKERVGTKKYVIEDSIEGWANAVGILISSYFEKDVPFPEYSGKNVSFDFTQIRPKGAYLSSCSGKAPGPEPLKKSLQNIRKILDNALESATRKLRPIQAYDIVMHCSDAVLSGGVRRSATICVFSADDEEMASAKTGNWFNENPQRGRSNNSVLLLKAETEFNDFQLLMEKTREFGEPGFIWSDDFELMINPCAEIGFYCYDDKGRSGWQMCNLSTINCAKVKTVDDFNKCCEAAAIIGTLQAGFDSFPYLGAISESIVKREALIGVSMTGIMEQHDICLEPTVQENGAEIVKQVNKRLARKIGINQAARTTAVKPEGTSSSMLGTSSGVHPHHAKRYLRRVQANQLEKVFQHFKSVNPIACEPSVWSANETDEVIAFCVEVPDGSKTKQQVSAIELLEAVKSTQEHWVIAGKNPNLCTQPWLTHNVSNTINIKDDEWASVTKFIYDNREFFCGISLISHTGDKDYPQAPFTTVYLPSEMVKYYGDGVMFVSGLVVKALELFDDNLWVASDAALGKIKVKGTAKKEWVADCKQFAERYFDDDMQKLTYCLKDIYNWKTWCDLRREYNAVDYTKCIEEEDNTNYEGESACAGGKCEI